MIISPASAKASPSMLERPRHQPGPVAVFDVAGMCQHSHDQPRPAHEDVPVVAADLLTGVVTPASAFRSSRMVVPSSTAVEGRRSRPSARRKSLRNSSWSRSGVTSFLRCMEGQHVIRKGCRSWRLTRHWRPDRATFNKASTAPCRPCLSGRSPVLAGGMNRPTGFFGGPVRSVE